MSQEPIHFYRLVREGEIVRLYRHHMDEPMGAPTFVDSSGVITAGNDSGLRNLIQDVRVRSQEEPDVWRGYYDADGYWRIKGEGGGVANGIGPVGKTFPEVPLQTPNEYRAAQQEAPVPPSTVEKLDNLRNQLADAHDRIGDTIKSIDGVMHHYNRVRAACPAAAEAMAQALLKEVLGTPSPFPLKAAE